MYDPKEHAPSHLTDGTLKMPHALSRQLWRRMALASVLFLLVLASLIPELLPAPLEAAMTMMAKPMHNATAWWQSLPGGLEVAEALGNIAHYFQQKLGNINL